MHATFREGRGEITEHRYYNDTVYSYFNMVPVMYTVWVLHMQIYK